MQNVERFSYKPRQCRHCGKVICLGLCARCARLFAAALNVRWNGRAPKVLDPLAALRGRVGGVR